MTAAPNDEAFLRRSFEVARRARAKGMHPFGAVLVGPDGAVLIDTENGFLPDHEMTAHAERLLATQASKAYSPNSWPSARFIRRRSHAPCAPARSIGAGIGRVVYGLGAA